MWWESTSTEPFRRGLPMRHKILGTVLGVCLFFGLAGTLHAQRTQGTISGTVSDSSGAVIPNAEVTITHEQTGSKRTVTTSDSGFYTMSNLDRSEEHTSELQSPCNLVCRLQLEKKKKKEK